MQNNINSVSFQAKLKPITKIKNKQAFTEARNIFTEATKNYPNDSIYITENAVGETVIRLSNNTGNGLYSKREIGIRNIDEQINEMGSDKFAKKLVNMFKALKLQENVTGKLTDIKTNLLRLENMMEFNKRAANYFKLEGKDIMANRYNVLANNNKGKISKLESEQQKFAEEYNNIINDLSKQYKEIIQLQIR